MKKVITPGELAIGMFVTVLENISQEQFKSDLFGNITTMKEANNSGCGDIIKILAIDLPYLVVENTDQYRSFICKMDTRVSVLMELSVDYVKALSPKLIK